MLNVQTVFFVVGSVRVAGFSWLFRLLFPQLLNLSWTGASLLKGLQSARSRLLHQNCTRNAKPFAQCQNVNFFKTPAQLLHHIVQCARTKGEAGTKFKPLGQLTFALKISISLLNLKGGWIFLQGFCKTYPLFSPEWQRGNDRKCFCLSPISTSQERVKAFSWMPPILQIFAHIFPFSTLKNTVLHIHLPRFLPICMYSYLGNISLHMFVNIFWTPL